MRRFLIQSTVNAIIAIALISVFVFSSNTAIASEPNEFERYMQDWTDKKEYASKLLLRAEEEFKAGDELSACATQKEASEFGISATESLMAAMKINGTMDSLENLEAGLNKWKEIGSLCSSFFN